MHENSPQNAMITTSCVVGLVNTITNATIPIDIIMNNFQFCFVFGFYFWILIAQKRNISWAVRRSVCRMPTNLCLCMRLSFTCI